MRRECREHFPPHRAQRKLLVSDPGMHHGTCVMHMSWCMLGSLTRGGRENVPSIPGACTTRNCKYLSRSPLLKHWIHHSLNHVIDMQKKISKTCLWHLIDDILTHWGRLTQICISKLTIIAWDNGLSPGQHQAIISTNAGILSTEPFGTNFNEIVIEIHTFSLKKIYLKMSSGKWQPFCLGLNVLMVYDALATRMICLVSIHNIHMITAFMQ